MAEMKIARLWRGPVPAAKADAYAAFLERVAIPDYAATPGNLGVRILRQDRGAEVEFMTLTFWTSWAAIEAFAGADLSKAKYYPEDADFLTRFDERVEHFEVVAETPPPA
jgi:heme-degrading monooxygenase HmoA